MPSEGEGISMLITKLGLNLTAVYPNTGQTLQDIIQLSTLYPGNISELTTKELFARIPRAMIDPNYVPQDAMVWLIWTHVIPYLVALASVVLRLYSRRKWMRQILLEDYMIVLSITLTLPYAIRSVYGAVVWHWGREVQDMTAHNLFMTIKVIWISSMLWPIPMVFVRLSLVLFFRRLYSKTSSRMIVYSNLLIGLTPIVAVSGILLVMLSCTPIEAAYNIWKRPTAGGCPHRYSTTILGALNLAVDLMIMVVPINLIYTIKVSTKKKVEYVCLLGLGVLAWGFNIAAIVTYYNAGQTSLAKTWVAELYSYLHTLISIVCSCAPAIRSLFNKPTKDLSSLMIKSRRGHFPKTAMSLGTVSTDGFSSDTMCCLRDEERAEYPHAGHEERKSTPLPLTRVATRGITVE